MERNTRHVSYTHDLATLTAQALLSSEIALKHVDSLAHIDQVKSALYRIKLVKEEVERKQNERKTLLLSYSGENAPPPALL